MIKGITLVRETSTPADFDKLASFFSALGLELGKGWKDENGRGTAFLAPLGNLEFIDGRLPGAADVFVEVVGLDAIREVAENWIRKNSGSTEPAKLITGLSATDWRSRLFTVEPVPGKFFTFWEWDSPLHGKPIAVEGDLSAAGMKFAIIVARWNAVITDRLLQGSIDALKRSGAKQQDIEVVRVPGAWEIPSAARTIAEQKSADAIITLGCLLRGETAHYEAIYNEVARGIGQSQQETGVPHAFGVLTCDTLEQALDRAGLKAGNKGFEAAIAAIEMVSVTRKLKATNTVTNDTPPSVLVNQEGI
jgi:6,7-dimethyl-8-ribityllumazine synthase